MGKHLDDLEMERVMMISSDENGFVVREQCDGYFSVSMTADELRQLGEEIIVIATSQKAKSPPE